MPDPTPPVSLGSQSASIIHPMSGGVIRSGRKMGAPRVRKSLIKSRRRVDDDDGEEEGSVAAGMEDDSLSEASAMSDADDDADVEGSDGSDIGSPVTKDSEGGPVANGHRDDAPATSQAASSGPNKPALAGTNADTERMMNGLKITGETEGEQVNFDDLVEDGEGTEPAQPAAQDTQATVNAAERSRREHEDYKKRRDADPAFVPNRGVFFMHDQRSSAPGQNGFRPFGRGKGRGRGNGIFPAFGQVQTGPADAPWAHDLHETVAQEHPPAELASASNQERQRPPVAVTKTQLPNRSFSGSRHVGNVQIRILLKGMAEPITFSAVPVNQHTRLPHHRPPLRRDKPVRISIPDSPIRYIFPATERSFIFIPRALRPNQQGFGRVRGRGSFAGSYSGFGPLSSRRTSVYAGSGYSPSVAMSRRSSLAREVVMDGVPSSAGSSFPRQPGAFVDAGKPVVRLPPAAEQLQTASQQVHPSVIAPTVNLPQASSYPPPPKFNIGGAGPDSLPMHHPRPERTVQVGDIDSPATLEFNPPQQQQQQPFHQQMPQLGSFQPDPSQYLHSRHLSHPSQAGTPLQHISENAIHAQPFQPFPYPQQQGFYPQPYAPPLYYYPPAPQSGEPPAAAAATFVPGQQYFYPVPMAAAPQPPGPETNARNQTVAHESGGMVYYYNSADLARNTETQAAYPAPTYGAPPLGMGDMMPYYPQPQVFYPTQPPQQ